MRQVMELAAAIVQVHKVGSPQARAEAIRIVSDARQQMYRLLSEDEDASADEGSTTTALFTAGEYSPAMDEQASFETRAVLAPRRARWTRLAILVPALALVAVAWAGLSGSRSDQNVAKTPDAVAVAASIDVVASGAATPPLRPRYPAQVIGLNVERLGAVQAQELGRDAVLAIAGWYVATSITDCPPLAAIYRLGALPEVRGDADKLAFCVRHGLLYASRPNLDERLPTNNLEDNRATDAGMPAVSATMAIGIIAPLELENVGARAWPVVVVGHFVASSAGCGAPAACKRELVIDHLAWAAGL